MELAGRRPYFGVPADEGVQGKRATWKTQDNDRSQPQCDTGFSESDLDILQANSSSLHEALQRQRCQDRCGSCKGFCGIAED